MKRIYPHRDDSTWFLLRLSHRRPRQELPGLDRKSQSPCGYLVHREVVLLSLPQGNSDGLQVDCLCSCRQVTAYLPDRYRLRLLGQQFGSSKHRHDQQQQTDPQPGITPTGSAKALSCGRSLTHILLGGCPCPAPRSCETQTSRAETRKPHISRVLDVAAITPMTFHRQARAVDFIHRLTW